MDLLHVPCRRVPTYTASMTISKTERSRVRNICGNAVRIAFPLARHTFMGTTFPCKNIYGNGVPMRSRPSTPLLLGRLSRNWKIASLPYRHYALFVGILCIYIPFLHVSSFIHRYFITFSKFYLGCSLSTIIKVIFDLIDLIPRSDKRDWSSTRWSTNSTRSFIIRRPPYIAVAWRWQRAAHVEFQLLHWPSWRSRHRCDSQVLRPLPPAVRCPLFARESNRKPSYVQAEQQRCAGPERFCERTHSWSRPVCTLPQCPLTFPVKLERFQ